MTSTVCIALSRRLKMWSTNSASRASLTGAAWFVSTELAAHIRHRLVEGSTNLYSVSKLMEYNWPAPEGYPAARRSLEK